MTLTEFLLARIAEDEDAAETVRTGRWDEISFHDMAADDVPHVVRNSPARVLAECEAKRRIVEARRAAFAAGGLHYAVQCLALPYADHPDYRDEWKP